MMTQVCTNALADGALDDERFDQDRSVISGAHFILRSVHESGMCDVCTANSKSCDCCLVFPYFEVWWFFVRGFSNIMELRGGFSSP